MLDKNIISKLSRIRRESEERTVSRRAAKIGKKYLNLSTTPITIEALAILPEAVAKEAGIVVIEKKANRIAVAAIDPKNAKTEKVIRDLENNYGVTVFVVSESSLKYALDYYKFAEKQTEDITGEISAKKKEIKEEDLLTLDGIKKFLDKEELSGSKANEILEIIFKGALANRASDIHFEPTGKEAKLRLRIDGLLHDVYTFELKFYSFIVSRIKLLSGLKLNVSNEPQDGRFTISFTQKDVEVRVAVAPAQFGEVIVMRLLDPDAINLDLKQLGLREDDLEIIEKELKRPNGLILNTGPTGSGKTTTLYAFLQHKKTPEIKIITIEDPIEYRISGIEQTQVDEESGYDFASGLKSLMRQDPDIILVGEIRDKETAEIGIQAALTGHLVFSTVHANSASGAVPRLLDLNVKPVSIGPALNLIIGQRLVRRLCANCRIPKTATNDLEDKVNNFLRKLPGRVNKDDYKEIKLFEAKGCPACNGTGFKGRIAIYELLKTAPEMEDLIIKQTGETAIYRFAVGNGMMTMQQDGILKVISGITTFNEVENVTGPIEWEE